MARFTTAGGSGSGAPGPQGPQGPAGDSAYDIAVENGFIGTEQEWLDSLGGSGNADIADFIFTSEEGQSIISLPGDKQMRIQAGEDSDLYLTAGDDLYIQTLGQGDDIFISAADDIRFSTNHENSETETVYGWRMDSEGEFHLPGNGYISNPSSVTYQQGNRVDTFTNNYLNDSTGINNTSSVALLVDETTMWYVMNQGSFTSPVTITFQDSTTVETIAIYDATSQGIPAVIFQWNTGDLVKTFEETFPLNIAVAYQTASYGQDTLVLNPASYGNDQYIVVDPTAPNHIHIRAGGQIDQSSADLILGGEENHVRISDGEDSVNILASNVNINSYTSPSSLNINTYSGAIINSSRTSTYAPEDKVVATLGDIQISSNNLLQSVRWTPNFTATGLTFTGTGNTHPTYNSHYVKQGQLVSFWIAVDCSTVTSFGTGQLNLSLPFDPLPGTMNHFSGWVFVDETANPDLAGHIIVNADHLPNTSVLDLHYIKQQGGANSPVMEAMLRQNTPVVLTTNTNIYVNGTYISA